MVIRNNRILLTLLAVWLVSPLAALADAPRSVTLSNIARYPLKYRKVEAPRGVKIICMRPSPHSVRLYKVKRIQYGRAFLSARLAPLRASQADSLKRHCQRLFATSVEPTVTPTAVATVAIVSTRGPIIGVSVTPTSTATITATPTRTPTATATATYSGLRSCDTVSQQVTHMTVQNPVFGGNHADPSVERIVQADGTAQYVMVNTAGNSGDIPLYTSNDLVNWTQRSEGAFGVSSANPMNVNGLNYCAVWAPQIHQLNSSGFMLSFAASRFSSSLNGCPAAGLDGGSYAAWSNNPYGPYAPTNHPWEPLPFAPSPNCPFTARNILPRSPDVSQVGCRLPGDCSATIRIDPQVFKDPLTGRSWLAYTWFTDSPPSAADRAWHGEHVSIVELDGSDPFTIKCSATTPRVHAGVPRDAALMQRLAQSCPRCGEMLSFTKDRFGNEMTRDGLPWGVAEGPGLFRRGNYVYLLMSANGWDSGYYQVYWVAAPTVEELRYNNPNRLVGRYLIPSNNQAFGHGEVVPGPDCKSWYYLHHRLRSDLCQQNGNCSRQLWLSPIEFEDHHDGLGDVYIKPRFPAEQTSVTVDIPR